MKKSVFLFMLAFCMKHACATEIFIDGHQFCRSGVDVSLYVEKSSRIKKTSGNNLKSGFVIFTYPDQNEIGHIITDNNEPRFINIKSLYIHHSKQKKGYGMEAMQTIEEMYGQYKDRIPNATHLRINIEQNNDHMVKMCEALGYKKMNDIFCPENLTPMIKEISRNNE